MRQGTDAGQKDSVMIVFGRASTLSLLTLTFPFIKQKKNHTLGDETEKGHQHQPAQMGAAHFLD